MSKFYNWLNEAGLSGSSRSGGMPNWDYYIIRTWPDNQTGFIDKDGEFLDNGLNKIGVIKKGDQIQILSKDLVIKGSSRFANIKKLKDKSIGYVNISIIQKPSKVTSKGVIAGGTNSKEFTPDKLKLNGKEFSSASDLARVVLQEIKSVYGGSNYDDIRNYIKECMSKVLGTKILFEEFTKTYKIDKIKIADSDLKVLSKNFGEVLLALFILSTNKKAKAVGFPSDISQKLYDFYSLNENGNKHYYSVKASGGSSTSLENINFVINNFAKDNIFFKKNKTELDIIMSLINNKKEGITTIKNIQNFFDTVLTNKKNEIIRELNRLTPKQKVKNLSQDQLTNWFKYVKLNFKVDDFVKTMEKIYNSVLSDIKKMKGTSNSVLKEIFNTGDPDKIYNGYLYYPMGSYIVDYLNNTGNYLEVLNSLLNSGTFITQIECTLSESNVTIKVKPFKKELFHFSYNAGSKYPGNRPIGFKGK